MNTEEKGPNYQIYSEKFLVQTFKKLQLTIVRNYVLKSDDQSINLAFNYWKIVAI